MPSLLNRIFEGLGSLYDGVTDAISDIRHKVVEEGWFGKQVTDTAIEKLEKRYPNDPEIWAKSDTLPTAHSIEPKRTPSFDELWACDDRAKGVEPPQAPDLDIDR